MAGKRSGGGGRGGGGGEPRQAMTWTKETLDEERERVRKARADAKAELAEAEAKLKDAKVALTGAVADEVEDARADVKTARGARDALQKRMDGRPVSRY